VKASQSMFWMGDPANPSDDQGDAKKKPARKRYDIPKTASCHVCGDLAAEHRHYGGISCYSCRAFFRRTVNSNRPILECSNDQNCKINKTTRKRCQFCRFEKCKVVGMNTGWVLREDNKSKLVTRRTTCPPGGGQMDGGGGHFVNMKKEEPQDIGQLHSEESITIKQRHASSPMSPPDEESSPFSTFSSHETQQTGVSPPQTSSNIFYNNAKSFLPGFGMHERGQTPQSQPFYHQTFNNPQQNAGSNYFQKFFTKTNNEDPIQHSSLFPLHINKMQVSVSGVPDGVSLTIETHPLGQNKREQSVSSNSTENCQNKHEQDFKNTGRGNQWSSQVNDSNTLSDNAPSPASLSSGAYKLNSKRQKRHHQQSRTIFRCFSSEDVERDCDSRSTIASPVSDSSGSHLQQDVGMNENQGSINEFSQVMLDDAFSSVQSISNECLIQSNQGVPPDQFKPQVWKLTEQSPMNPSPLPQLNRFTLQETLFVEQLTAIDERVRCQVPMELSHGRSFLDCSLSGNFISQMTIMHAYQTCIKRVVRFANSLQDFVELPPDDMQKLLVSNTVSIINIRIARWFHPKTDLKSQISLCGAGQDLFKEAIEEGKLSHETLLKVGYDDVFSSPWCCDFSHEDRYETLIRQIHQLDLDSTVVVLLSVMCLFDSEQVEDLNAKSTIVSHRRKFSLLLER